MKNMYKTGFVLSVTLLIVLNIAFAYSFHKNKSDYKAKYFDKFDVKQRIIFNEIIYPELLGETMQLIKNDNYLFVNDYFGDSLVHVFNLNTNVIERKIASKGVGPNEVITPLDIKFADDSLYLLSRPTYSLYHLELNSLYNDSTILYKDHCCPIKI